MFDKRVFFLLRTGLAYECCPKQTAMQLSAQPECGLPSSKPRLRAWSDTFLPRRFPLEIENKSECAGSLTLHGQVSETLFCVQEEIEPEPRRARLKPQQWQTMMWPHPPPPYTSSTHCTSKQISSWPLHSRPPRPARPPIDPPL